MSDESTWAGAAGQSCPNCGHGWLHHTPVYLLDGSFKNLCPERLPQISEIVKVGEPHVEGLDHLPHLKRRTLEALDRSEPHFS